MDISALSLGSRIVEPQQTAVRPPQETNDSESFLSALAASAASTASSLKQAENVSMQALRGDVDTRQLVESISRAEQSLQTTLAVRDKLVAAFQEISRMAI
jgi:flagellar hook-basal body complex protein FliE